MTERALNPRDLRPVRAVLHRGLARGPQPYDQECGLVLKPGHVRCLLPDPKARELEMELDGIVTGDET